jgi:hypothetical protein
MKCKKTGPINVLILFLLFSLNAISQDKGFQFIPDNVIKHDNYTVLIAQDGRHLRLLPGISEGERYPAFSRLPSLTP